MAPVTMRELRAVVRLHRAGVHGAHQQLESIIDEHGAELPALLGFPAENLGRLRNCDDPVELLATTVESAPRLTRDARQKSQRAHAIEVAIQLAHQATLQAAGIIELDAALLSEVARLVGSAPIQFGDRGWIGAARLRSFFRECRRVETCTTELTEHTLDIVYTTACSRGRVRFVLSLSPAADCVNIPLGQVRRAHANQPAMVAPPTPARPRPPRPRRSRRFAERFADALLEAAVGGLLP